MVFSTANHEDERVLTNMVCLWITQIMQGGSDNIKVNDGVGHFFQTKKGVRQGDLIPHPL
jgi:hypothetical protein